MNNLVKAIVYEKIGKVGIRDLELPECGPGEIVCETLYTFVSPGTELRVLYGHYSSENDFPLVPGYSVVAQITELGKDVKGFRVGDIVSGRNPKPLPEIGSKWGGQASRHVYKTEGEDRPVLLPAGSNPLDYAIAEVAAISFRGVEAADPRPGESAVVIGQGLIGAFSAAWLMVRGCRVIVCDIDENRLKKARNRGVSAALNLNDADAIERIALLCNGGADIVVESSGTSAGVLTAYKLLRKKPQAYGKEYKVEPIGFYHGDWPRLILQANYIENISIDPFSIVPGEGVTVIAPKDRGIEDRQKVVEAIRNGSIKPGDFIEAVLPFTEAPSGYADLKERKYLSLAFRWRQ